MVVNITKDMSADEIKAALKKLPNLKANSLRSFYGKLKDAFGDGLEYQKMMRGEWRERND